MKIFNVTGSLASLDSASIVACATPFMAKGNSTLSWTDWGGFAYRNDSSTTRISGFTDMPQFSKMIFAFMIDSVDGYIACLYWNKTAGTCKYSEYSGYFYDGTVTVRSSYDTIEFGSRTFEFTHSTNTFINIKEGYPTYPGYIYLI